MQSSGMFATLCQTWFDFTARSMMELSSLFNSLVLSIISVLATFKRICKDVIVVIISLSNDSAFFCGLPDHTFLVIKRLPRRSNTCSDFFQSYVFFRSEIAVLFYIISLIHENYISIWVWTLRIVKRYHTYNTYGIF